MHEKQIDAGKHILLLSVCIKPYKGNCYHGYLIQLVPAGYEILKPYMLGSAW